MTPREKRHSSDDVGVKTVVASGGSKRFRSHYRANSVVVKPDNSSIVEERSSQEDKSSDSEDPIFRETFKDFFTDFHVIELPKRDADFKIKFKGG